MELKNFIELKMKDFDDCYALCKFDCSVGRIYDFTCALQQFCIQRMNESAEAHKKAEEKLEEKQA